jgi:trehalose/maltose hydrolase-like predicted phosphorylase
MPVLNGTQEQHINADVAYAVWRYWQATRDVAFLLEAGAEIILETARFWASRAQLEPDGRYHIRVVIGPDEYHDTVDDNAYTNGLAAWNLNCGLMIAASLRTRWPRQWAELWRRLDLSESELGRWQDVAARLARGFDPASGLFEQFEGFFRLEDIDLRGYASQTTPVDVLLGADRTRQAQVVKQPDVLMLLALLPGEYDRRIQQVNFRYYEPRCAHGSSLSPAIHALLAARLGKMELAQHYFRQAAAIDLEDTRGDGAFGVHMATLGGLWQAAVFGFGGLTLEDSGVRLDPHLPVTWRRLAFNIRWRGRQMRFEVRRDPAQVSAWLEHGPPLSINVHGDRQRLSRGAPMVWTT